jgi:hypothetical protein
MELSPRCTIHTRGVQNRSDSDSNSADPRLPYTDAEKRPQARITDATAACGPKIVQQFIAGWSNVHIHLNLNPAINRWAIFARSLQDEKTQSCYTGRYAIVCPLIVARVFDRAARWGACMGRRTIVVDYKSRRSNWFNQKYLDKKVFDAAQTAQENHRAGQERSCPRQMARAAQRA